MIRSGSRILRGLSATTQLYEIGGARIGRVIRGRTTLSPLGRLVAMGALASTFSACQSQTGSSAYPDLRSVSAPSDTSYPLEKRRQIARELIEDRDLAQHKKAIVRYRSGLSDIPPPAAPAPTATRAEDIVRETPVAEQEPVGEATESSSDRAYRDRAQFDDGTLDDFIRRLKRDTAPPLPAEEENSSDQSEVPEPQSRYFQLEPSLILEPSLTNVSAASEHWPTFRPVVFLAFAPAGFPEKGPLAVRLAAAETDPGIFCSYLGWMVAWSNACLDQESVAESESDTASTSTTGSENDGVSDDVEDGTAGNQGAKTGPDEQTAENAPPGTGSAGDKTSDQSQMTPEGEAGPSEDIDGESLLPVSSTLDRLRNLIRSRNSSSNPASSTGSKSLAYDAFKIEPEAAPGPPLPTSRPKVEKDLLIVRNDRVFEFTRTPTPAFKPTPPEPKIVIFPPEKPRPPAKATFHPAARPAPVAAHRDVADLEPGPTEPEPGIDQDEPEPDMQPGLSEPEPESQESEPEQQAILSDVESSDDTEVETPEEQRAPAASEPAAPAEPAAPEEPDVLDSEIIRFDPRSPKLPAGVELRLREMLDEARASNGKLFIISEAGIGNLAMERARSVGLALVRLGATADEIEYDIVVDRRVDQVRLLLKPNGDGPG